MWLVFLVLAAVVVAAIFFSMNRDDSVVDTDVTVPATTEPVATEPATPGSAPLETAPADPGTGTADPNVLAPDSADPAPAPGTGGTTQP
jgi:hypothetical protein